MKKLWWQAGSWLRERRQSLGFTQRAFAVLVGAEPYTMIAQLESGRGRIPPERYERWANALRLIPAELVRRGMRFYDPETYRLLFGAGLPRETVVHLAFRKDAGKAGDAVKPIMEKQKRIQ